MIRVIFFSMALVVVTVPTSWAADWPECRNAKRESVRLQKALRDGRKLSGYSSGSAMKKARRDKDIWLRKNCRYHSQRLRDLEREMM